MKPLRSDSKFEGDFEVSLKFEGCSELLRNVQAVRETFTLSVGSRTRDLDSGDFSSPDSDDFPKDLRAAAR